MLQGSFTQTHGKLRRGFLLSLGRDSESAWMEADFSLSEFADYVLQPREKSFGGCRGVRKMIAEILARIRGDMELGKPCRMEQVAR
jgi:hypothetical protein